MNTPLLLLSGALLVTGAFLLLVAAIGLLRFPDLPMRMHAVLKAGTVGAVLAYAAMAVAVPTLDVIVRIAGAVALVLLAAPLGAFLLAPALLEKRKDTFDQDESAGSRRNGAAAHGAD